MSSSGVAEATTAPQTVAYGDHPDQVVEVHPPVGKTSGLVVVLLHGGFWESSVDRRHLRPMARGLAAAGHVVALPEFRRVGAGGGWPETFDDVARAVDRAAELAAVCRGVPAGLRATVVVGHSSGGHLAAWCAGRTSLPPESSWFQETSSVIGCVCLSGAVDLRLSGELGLGDGATASFLGGTPDEVPDRYRQADPAALAPAVRVTLLHPADDPVVPISVARSYAAAATGFGGHAELKVLPGADHFLLTTPSAAGWAEVLAGIDDVSR